MRVYGREKAVKLVYDFSVREPRRATPVLLLAASKSSGKTTLLRNLGEHLDQRVPYAGVNFDELGQSTICDVLSLLGFELNRHCAPYGRLGLPRFIVGQIVMSAPDVDHTVPAQARNQIQQRIEEYRKIPKLRAFLQGLVPTVAPVNQQLIDGVLDMLLSGLTSWRPMRQVVLGSGMEWYAHQDRGLTREPLDTLVELNRRAQKRDIEGNGQWVDEIMLAAFLADLRAAFGRHSLKKLGFNCVILLDNVDGTLARRFLNALVRAYEQRTGNLGEQAGPVVVATSRGPLAAHIAQPGEVFPGTDTASVEDYTKRYANGPRRWWYPVRLPDLTLVDVRNMVAARELRGCNPEHVALTVHEFTRGHAGAVSELLTAIAEQPTDPVDLRSVLERKTLDATVEGTVWDLLRRLLLTDLSNSDMDDLTTCAAARDIEQAVRLANHSELWRGDDIDVITRADLWIPGTVSGTSVMHPVVRRLLLERLARRDPTAHNSWTAVHEWLRRHAAEEEDETGELHHTLALGNVQHVTGEMARRLHDPDITTETWIRDLDAVVVAPCRARIDVPPVEYANALTGWVSPRDHLTKAMALLVAGRWVAAEPLITSERADLYRIISQAFLGVAPSASEGIALLIHESKRYQELADRWS